jgi:hypothetical protein
LSQLAGGTLRDQHVYLGHNKSRDSDADPQETKTVTPEVYLELMASNLRTGTTRPNLFVRSTSQRPRRMNMGAQNKTVTIADIKRAIESRDAAMLELEEGKIVRQTDVQAWDA